MGSRDEGTIKFISYDDKGLVTRVSISQLKSAGLGIEQLAVPILGEVMRWSPFQTLEMPTVDLNDPTAIRRLARPELVESVLALTDHLLAENDRPFALDTKGSSSDVLVSISRFGISDLTINADWANRTSDQAIGDVLARRLREAQLAVLESQSSDQHDLGALVTELFNVSEGR